MTLVPERYTLTSELGRGGMATIHRAATPAMAATSHSRACCRPSPNR